MKGKIFKDSSNIYQDQAKILFNYYQQMAERIVQEEERLEIEIAKLNGEKEKVKEEIESMRLWKWVFGILIIPFVYYSIKESALQKKLDALDDKISDIEEQHEEIFRDYKVTKLGVAYIPVAEQVKYENKSFIVDYSGTIPESDVRLQLPKENDLLIDAIAELKNLSAVAPIIENSNDIETIETGQYSRSMQQLNQYSYLGKLERSLRTVSNCMDEMSITQASLPLVNNESSYLKFLKEYATDELPGGALLLNVFDAVRYKPDISKFKELSRLKDSLSHHTEHFEEVLKNLMITMAHSVQAISALKVASTNKLIFESNKVLYTILKSPYNHYSPYLEAVEIERIRNENFNYNDASPDYVPFQLKKSSKVRYNLLSNVWTAEDGSITNFPFGLHQIQEEIIAPIIQNLMNETRTERLKIYNHIKDQKISYLNKWHQDMDDFYGRNRAESSDLINLMRVGLRDYVAAYNTLSSLKKTEESMMNSGGSLDSTIVAAVEDSAEILAAFEAQSKEFRQVQNDFENYMARLKDDIELKAADFEHIDFYDAMLRDETYKEIAIATHDIQSLDARRKPMIAVNPLFAKVSDIPPLPTIEDITYKQILLNLPVIARKSLEELGDNPENYGMAKFLERDEDDEIEVELDEEDDDDDFDDDDFDEDFDDEDDDDGNL
ncbi:hypothetical protein FACS189411_02430 [Bacteroidia bacterium]|nr:hypothetical protein FACS189411_02430 [Bacteroidia bacterium]